MEDTRPYTVIAEGPPLAGKTTQLELLRDELETDGHNVLLLQRETEACPSRERINELREQADGWTRDVIDPDEETQLWAQYYREKNDVINAAQNDPETDYVLVDRYAMSLLPVQEPAVDADLDELVARFEGDIREVEAGATIVLTATADEFAQRYRQREGTEIPEEFLNEVLNVQQNYRRLGSYFDVDYIDTAGQDLKAVQNEVRTHLEPLL